MPLCPLPDEPSRSAPQSEATSSGAARAGPNDADRFASVAAQFPVKACAHLRLHLLAKGFKTVLAALSLPMAGPGPRGSVLSISSVRSGVLPIIRCAAVSTICRKPGHRAAPDTCGWSRQAVARSRFCRGKAGANCPAQ